MSIGVDKDPMSLHQLPRMIRPLRDFLHTEAAGGVVLLAATVVALVWANSPWDGLYRDLWSTELSVRVGSRSLSLDLRHWVNDGLMAVFFFVVGLEIKRELVGGELSDHRRAVLPACAALGGMIVPVLLYLAVNVGGDGARGWGIPMATDIALAMGVLALVAPHIDPALKLFLLALAIVDDIGAIVVIAVFYSDGINLTMLLGALAALASVLALRRAGVQRIWPYVALGTGLWFLTLQAGVHATLAGVALGLMTPAHAHRQPDLVDADELTDLGTVTAAHETAVLARQSVSIVEWLEHLLHPWSSFAIIPVFALANTGIAIDSDAITGAANSRVSAGIVLGLVVGKPLGITLAAWLAVRTGIGTLSDGTRWRSIFGVAALAGIGFTVALFIAEQAFPGGAVGGEATIGILVASLLSAALGTVLLRRSP